MAKKLSVVISGAVSLGSYEAGVMYEVLETIARHNSLVSNTDDQIEIDQITGASAGGMTACILAQNLLYDDGSMHHPYQNVLYRAWVKMVDIVPLLDVSKDDQKRSLLSHMVIDSIANELLVNDEVLTARLQADPHSLSRHPAVANKLHIGVAMSNLNGFSYSSKTSGDVPLQYTRFKDQLICQVERQPDGGFRLQEMQLMRGTSGADHWEPGHDMSWSLLRAAGVSSGAFPLAFPLRTIQREPQQGRFEVRQGPFSYTDGGVFENEPVGMAHSMLANGEDDQRYYLLVKPGPRAVSTNLSGEADLLKTLLAVVGAVIQQAQFQDFIMKEISEDNRLFTITSDDTVLVGDVLSAFSGFLEEKFRAYDYNVGRSTAQNQLKRAADNNLLCIDPTKVGVMPPIEWVVGDPNDPSDRRNWSWTLGRALESWEDAESLMHGIASTSGSQSQIKDLHRLMLEVNPETRLFIADQLRSRLANLIDYVNDQYLKNGDDKLAAMTDEVVGEWFEKHLKIKLPNHIFDLLPNNLFSGLREGVGQPLFKLIADALLKAWLEANVIDPPEQ
jgi:hypothetical protein